MHELSNASCQQLGLHESRYFHMLIRYNCCKELAVALVRTTGELMCY
jgi:hypothetical protein